MAQVEGCLGLREGSDDLITARGELPALVDSLHAGTLNDAQQETVQALRIAILAAVES
jgi:hypothetical protein